MTKKPFIAFSRKCASSSKIYKILFCSAHKDFGIPNHVILSKITILKNKFSICVMLGFFSFWEITYTVRFIGPSNYLYKTYLNMSIDSKITEGGITLRVPTFFCITSQTGSSCLLAIPKAVLLQIAPGFVFLNLELDLKNIH